ncbi:hypothetical protein AB434_0318 [Heyndrickxia coagulans]|uniref:Uncharacterized protein n=1 Tax=Heyndrickxia coagulans TaxID=1398 RepID=A0A0C5C0C8_HEYCO|nr:hypothetical protein SB48_HM08orf01344 [Heyndrickxia coagulans]AKN52723.1 hypothetical protein AB434_0318 [Heyndrickxia coagulans]KWZ85084.1 hypothetical protein HMPREF3213_00603 [Heyndrickxia coagulans]KYC89972.1 hypothetical protein B4096_2100 [Heyndrickxia coagulans]
MIFVDTAGFWDALPFLDKSEDSLPFFRFLHVERGNSTGCR